jgi:hypothetical protein
MNPGIVEALTQTVRDYKIVYAPAGILLSGLKTV